MVEATAVAANGRITPEDSGIWLDAHVLPLSRHVDFAHSQGQKNGIQLAHAGRKASTVAPWLSRGAVATKAVGGWPDDVVAPRAGPHDEHHARPREMTLAEIAQLKEDFVSAARRAVKAGFDVVELHNAHGYLLHNFVSPATNTRADQYGGSFEIRTWLSLEIAEAVRDAIPDEMPRFCRISATDWSDEADGYDGASWTVADSTRLALLLADRGVDVLEVSSGGSPPAQNLVTGPGYQAGFAKAFMKPVEE